MSDADTKAYGQSWYAATMVDEPRRPRLAVDLDVDVCVIGGGLAGLTAAREIARSGWSVVLLEANRIASGASGRNTGFVLPGFAADADKLIARVGFERAKSLWALAQAGLDYVRNAVHAEGAAGIDPQDGWLYVSKVDNGDEFVRFVRLLDDLGCEIEGWPTDRVRAVLHSERYFHAIHYLKAIAIHPLNYALSLAAAAERNGARIFENTPALAIDPQGVRKRIVTPSARLRANHVVLAGNVQIGGLVPRIAATLLPITTYIITTAPLGERLATSSTIAARSAIRSFRQPLSHRRRRPADAVGPLDDMGAQSAPLRAGAHRRYQKIYPQLKNVSVDYNWSGTLGNTVHRMPQIGELGQGVWLASGFGGHGLNTTAMAGNLVARAIVEGDQTWREFSPFELVWAGGIAARAGVQMRNWIKRYRDRIEQSRAKARELAHIQAREAEKMRQAAEAEEMRQAAEAAEQARLAAEAEERARQGAEAEEAARLAAEEGTARLAAEAEEAVRLAAATEASLQSVLQQNANEKSAAEEVMRDGELITPADVTPEPVPPLTGAPSKRRSRNRRRRERTQS